MTVFALMIWAWDVTGSATSLALVTFFLPASPHSRGPPLAGIMVDRFPRKHLMILGDVVAMLCTLRDWRLYWAGQLQVWHLYGAVALYGCFGADSNPAYSTSIALLVPPDRTIPAAEE